MGIKTHPMMNHLQFLSQQEPGNVLKALQIMSSGKSLGALKDLMKFDLLFLQIAAALPE